MQRRFVIAWWLALCGAAAPASAQLARQQAGSTATRPLALRRASPQELLACFETAAGRRLAVQQQGRAHLVALPSDQAAPVVLRFPGDASAPTLSGPAKRSKRGARSPLRSIRPATAGPTPESYRCGWPTRNKCKPPSPCCSRLAERRPLRQSPYCARARAELRRGNAPRSDRARPGRHDLPTARRTAARCASGPRSRSRTTCGHRAARGRR